MSRRFIRQGDKTDRNGVVVDGIAGTSLQGQPFAYLGACSVPHLWDDGCHHKRRLTTHDDDDG